MSRESLGKMKAVALEGGGAGPSFVLSGTSILEITVVIRFWYVDIGFKAALQ